MLKKSFFHTLNTIKRSKLSFASVVFADFLNFFAFGMVHVLFFLQIFPLLENISKLSGLSALQAFDSQTEEQLSQVMLQVSEFTDLYSNLITSLAYYGLSLLVIWVLFQSISWYLSSEIIAKHKFGFRQYLSYLIKFAYISVLCFAVFSLLIFIIFKVIFLFTFTNVEVKADLAPYLIGAAILLVLYLSLAAYTKLGSKNMFHSTLKQLIRFNFAAVSVISASLLALISLLITYLADFLAATFITSLIMVVPLVILVFPLIAFARLWLIEATR